MILEVPEEVYPMKIEFRITAAEAWRVREFYNQWSANTFVEHRMERKNVDKAINRTDEHPVLLQRAKCLGKWSDASGGRAFPCLK